MGLRTCRYLIALILFLPLGAVVNAQTSANDKVTPAKVATDKKAADQKAAELKAENDRIAKERRASARSLLLSLASDARNFRDQSVRARSQARIADALWSVDGEQARSLFRKAWDAAEVGDKEGRQHMLEEMRQQKARTGSTGALVYSPPNLRGEVLRLVAKRDRALGEEFLEKLKEARAQEGQEESGLEKGPLMTPDAIRQRLSLANQLLQSGDVERALQFADPVLSIVSTDGLDFLTNLRASDPAAADRRYAALVASAETNPQSEANTVSLLSAYIFTPHLFITFTPDGGTNSAQTGRMIGPPNVEPELRTAFLLAAAQILLRPLPPPEQDQTTAGRQGKYLVVKRLLPLFVQYAPRETAEVMRAQLDVLAAVAPEAARKPDDDEWVNKGIAPDKKSEDREQSLRNRLDHAKTSEERDQIYLELAMLVAQQMDFRARDFVDKIDDAEVRKQARAYVDMTLALQSVAKKDTDHALEISKVGELTHVQRVWLLAQVGKLLAKTDREKSLAILDQATDEVRRIDGSDPDRARGLLAIANAFMESDRSRGWETALEATKAANSAEGFTGEDGGVTIKLETKGMNSIRSSSAEDFNVAGLFGKLGNEDYERAVQLARNFQGEAPRAVATIAIARSVLEQKPKAVAEKK